MFEGRNILLWGLFILLGCAATIKGKFRYSLSLLLESQPKDCLWTFEIWGWVFDVWSDQTWAVSTYGCYFYLAKEHTLPTVKHRTIMLHGISASCTKNLVQVQGITERGCHLRLALNHCWVFQHDNDLKHASKLVQSFLKDTKIVAFQSPDLHPFETLWPELKVHAQNPHNSDELEQLCNGRME